MKGNFIFYTDRLTKQDVHFVFCDSDPSPCSTRKARIINYHLKLLV